MALRLEDLAKTLDQALLEPGGDARRRRARVRGGARASPRLRVRAPAVRRRGSRAPARLRREGLCRDRLPARRRALQSEDRRGRALRGGWRRGGRSRRQRRGDGGRRVPRRTRRARRARSLRAHDERELRQGSSAREDRARDVPPRREAHPPRRPDHRFRRADFAANSTGRDGAAPRADVELLRECLPEAVAVKASGRIETLADVQSMVDAGATRVGTARAAAIMNEAREPV